jgi:ferredoxin-NADP reductase
MPRLYSIASSPEIPERRAPHGGDRAVRDESPERVGVCSTFLADRVQVGSTPVPVFVSHSHFGPPEDGAKDCIMIGPGTGIAPFRAFVQDRWRGATGRNWVFFGDQKRGTDFLYEEEWADYLAKKQLTRLDLALVARPVAQGLRPGPHARKRGGALALVAGRGVFLRVRRRQAHGQGRRHGAARDHRGTGWHGLEQAPTT